MEATAAALEVEVAGAKSAADLSGLGPEALVLVDLNHPSGAVEAIRALKGTDPAPRVIAFGSHVDAERLKAAREAGADKILARSAFTARLPEILKPNDDDTNAL